MSRLLTMVNGRPGATGSGAVVLVASGTAADLCWGRLAAPPPAGGGAAAVLIRVGDGGRVAKLLDWVLLPIARARVERLLARHRTAPARAAVYAVAPDCEAPTWVYRLGTPAAAYADSHLLSRVAGLRAIRAIVRWWTGCDATVAGLLVIGGR